ncbi:APC family permease [Pleurocapsa sp. FMAR1]|uniref:APC family permease n=1 Tax=Pleurocapsa sp. FMAR1 TaxID=3040204 RepID=UPI0029C8CE31|nr:amino acid permease [Pleurocapsa sp. FMAR1]
MKLAVRSTIALKPTLSLIDTVAIIVGIVVGASIFETPSLVAANAGSTANVLLTWGLGGVISLIGALCYAELATNYPHPGGTYYYLKRSFGKAIAFLFAWTRLSVIQTGSIALLAFVFGDYASQLWRWGDFSSVIYAAIAIVFLTGLNLLGVRQGKQTQTLLAFLQVTGLIVISAIALAISFSLISVSTVEPTVITTNLIQSDSAIPRNFGLMMVFILLSYGGWNEAAYISAEVRNGRQNIVKALVWSIGIITTLYLLINWALIRGLGLTQMAESQAVVADLMRLSLGETGAVLTSLLVAIATICSLNATIITGARANYALGQDVTIFAFLKRGHGNTPANALILQAAIALLLVGVGTFTRQGFETMVDFTAPAFWFFFLLSGISLFILRRRDRNVERYFSVPFYPLTPLMFCGICAYMLRASLVYTGWGGLLGAIVPLLGLPLLWWNLRQSEKVTIK